MTDALIIDQSKVPGGLQEYKRRELPDGALLEFEYAPEGFLTKKGDPRKKEWRAYYLTPAGADKRARYPSVSTLLDTICPKDGLPHWAEARGIEGCLEAVRIGNLDPTLHTGEEAVQTVRALRLGADRARDDAADRGLNVHALLEAYMRTGTPPNPAEHPEPHRGYLQALTRWLLKADPEPVAVEQLVVNVVDAYAGRVDLRARIGGLLTTADAKSQERGQIYRGAHLQAGLYERAAVACGDEPADQLLVVVFAANGEFREMHCAADPAAIDAALAFYRSVRPIDSACESANRIEREARRAA